MTNFELDTADVLQVLLLILGAMLVFQAFWLFGTALFPRMVGQARDRYKTPIRTTLIGLAVVVPTFFIGIFWLQNIDNIIVKIIGLVIGVVPLILGAIGSAGLCQLIGLGLPACQLAGPDATGEFDEPEVEPKPPGQEVGVVEGGDLVFKVVASIPRPPVFA
jgi:hypothetical protein